MARKRYLIIGDGAAGFTAAQTLRQVDRSATIAIITDDPNPAYFRAALTNYLLGELREDQIWAVPPDFYDAWEIHRVFARVLSVDTARSHITLSTGGQPEHYDGLLVASGARARHPSFPGAELSGVLTLRTVQDVRRVVDWLKLRSLKKAVVLGGGALGLEWAHGLREHGVSVLILERGTQFLPRLIDQVASDLLTARLQQAGIEVRLGCEIKEAYASSDGSVRGVGTTAGETIWCELIASAIGVQCNSEFLLGSGVALSPSGAVVVDERMQSSVKGVWAAGDVAELGGDLPQLWEPARLQGRVAGQSMCGKPAVYRPGAPYFATRLFDLDFASVGTIDDDAGTEQLVDFPRGTGQIAYRKLLLRDGKLIGGIMLGERQARVRASARAFKRLVDLGAEVRSIREDLLDPSFDIDAWIQTNKLLEKPEAKRATAQVPSVAQIRGTQVLAIAAGSPKMAGTSLLSGELGVAATAPEPSAGKGTEALGAQIAAGTMLIQPPGERSENGSAGPASSKKAARTMVLPDPSPRTTRKLSIGLPAEAPMTEARGVPPDGRLEARGQSWPITGPVTSIGRDPSAAVVLDDATVAAQHAQVVHYGTALYLRDLGSRSGTWINGSPLTNAHRLGDGDQIRVGAVELVFRSDALAKTAAFAAAPASERAPRIEVRSGGNLGLSFMLGADTAVIGRSPDCALRVDDMSVGWHHASIRPHHGHHYLSALSVTPATWYRGQPLAPGHEVPLQEGDVVRAGEIDLLYTSAPLLKTMATMVQAKGRLHVDQGSAAGRHLVIQQRALIGAQEGCSLVLRDQGILPSHLEIVARYGGFAVRDLSQGASFLRGAPIGADFVPLSDGDVLLLGGSVMLRFEESP